MLTKPKPEPAPKPKRRAAPKKAATPRAAIKRQPELVRAKILHAASKAFARDGFKGARMRAIATDAGITAQLLVHHFKSKEGLWKALMTDFFERYDHLPLHSDPKYLQARPAEKLRQEIVAYVEVMSAEPEIFKIFTQEAAQKTPRLIWMVDRYLGRIFNDMCELIRLGQVDGEVKPGNPVIMRYALVAISNLPFAVAGEYEYMTGKSPFSADVRESLITFLEDLMFVTPRRKGAR